MNISRWLVLGLACCGCGSSPDTAYYALAAARGTIRQASLGTIEVRRPGIAGYLDRAEILMQWDGHRIQLAPNAAWGEPIGSMIGRVLAEDLTERLRGTIVFSAASDFSIQASAVVELAIWKFDLDRDGFLHLNGLVSVHSPGGQVPQSTRTIALQARADTTDIGAVVATMSRLLGQLADEIATTLVARGETVPRAAVPEAETLQAP
jgi:uncharacterized lipoprotein YmbA